MIICDVKEAALGRDGETPLSGTSIHSSTLHSLIVAYDYVQRGLILATSGLQVKYSYVKLINQNGDYS